MVTVGLQTYNRADSYLRQAIDSILSQTYKDFELVISDNASTDNTEEICREYAKKDHRIRYIRQKTNIEYVSNANFLRTQIRGKYFAWMADDDVWAPTFLEKCVAKIEDNPDVILAAANIMDFDDFGRKGLLRIGKKFCPTEKDLYRRLKDYILMYESEGKDLPVYCAVWRREAVVNYFYTDYFIKYPYNWDFQDMDFVFYGLIKGPFEFTDEVLFHKRAKSDSFNPPRKKTFFRRLFDSFLYSRLKRLLTPFFYRRMGKIIKVRGLSIRQKFWLIFWNIYVMSRFFWKRKI